MKKLKQCLAIVGILLLLGMYGLTLVFAFSDNPNSENLLMASLYSTVLVPVFLYAVILVNRLVKGNSSSKSTEKAETSKAHAQKKYISESEPIDTLIFDIGQVLVHYDWQTYLQTKHYDEETLIAVADAVFLSDDWQEGDRGVLTEEEILNSYIENAPAYEKEIRDTFEHMGNTIHTFKYTKSWLSHLKKKGYKLYILSNFSEPLYKRCEKEMDFIKVMDGGFMSYQVKMMKPEPQFYQKLLKDYDIDPKRAIFIDDVLENVAEARVQGLHAIHFTTRKEVLQTLANFGVE